MIVVATPSGPPSHPAGPARSSPRPRPSLPFTSRPGSTTMPGLNSGTGKPSGKVGWRRGQPRPASGRRFSEPGFGHGRHPPRGANHVSCSPRCPWIPRHRPARALRPHLGTRPALGGNPAGTPPNAAVLPIGPRVGQPLRSRVLAIDGGWQDPGPRRTGPPSACTRRSERQRIQSGAQGSVGGHIRPPSLTFPSAGHGICVPLRAILDSPPQVNA